MKCPKCEYLGFDTGDRCKNCGYDFSLIPQQRDAAGTAHVAAAAFDLDLNRPVPDGKPAARDLSLHQPAAAGDHGRAAVEDLLPLFSPAGADDDQPLVKLPAAPRAPLAVRRTPDASRSRSAARAPRPPREPVLQFPEDRAAAPLLAAPEPPPIAPADAPVLPRRATRPLAPAQPLAMSGVGPRVTAVAIDFLILGAIDAVVIYFTLRLAALSMGEWALLPPIPLIAFLLLLKLGYFAALTSVGGQTIGKMAAGIRVVTDDNRALDPERAVRRTLASLLSAVTLGAGFVVGLMSADHRALHDRLARTRVVALRS